MSTIKVNTIEPYSGSTVTIPSGSVNTAENLTAGDKTLTGTLTQNFTAPGNFEEKQFVNVTGAQINSTNYARVFQGFADYTAFGNNFSDYFTIEYYDGIGYNFGTEFNVNGIQTRLATFASGSGQGAQIKTTDNGDGTAQITLEGTHVVVSNLGNYADDTAAAAGGVKVNGLYRNGSVLQIRVS